MSALSEVIAELRHRLAEGPARKKFRNWQREHPQENRILELLDTESYHRPAANTNPRRFHLWQAAVLERRDYGVSDELAELARRNSFIIDEALARMYKKPSSREIELLKTVNEGYVLRAGYSTPYIRKPIKWK